MLATLLKPYRQPRDAAPVSMLARATLETASPRTDESPQALTMHGSFRVIDRELLSAPRESGHVIDPAVSNSGGSAGGARVLDGTNLSVPPRFGTPDAASERLQFAARTGSSETLSALGSAPTRGAVGQWRALPRPALQHAAPRNASPPRQEAADNGGAPEGPEDEGEGEGEREGAGEQGDGADEPEQAGARERRETNLPCQTCGRVFGSAANLRAHVRTHTGERPFVCQVCGWSFAQRSNLRRHQLTHDGVKRFTCTYCGKLFSRKASCVSHVKAQHCSNAAELTPAFIGAAAAPAGVAAPALVSLTHAAVPAAAPTLAVAQHAIFQQPTFAIAVPTQAPNAQVADAVVVPQEILQLLLSGRLGAVSVVQNAQPGTLVALRVQGDAAQAAPVNNGDACQG